MQQWPRSVFDAYRNNTENLCDYLRATDCSLNPIQRRQLADLIDRKINVKAGKGRKPGKTPLWSELVAEFESSITPRAGPLANERRPQKNNEARNKPSFQYQKRTPEMLERRLRTSSWAQAIIKAQDRDAKDLCDYLSSADLPLDSQQLEDFADLIDRKMNLKPGKGRKPGRFTPLEERQGVITTSVAVSVIKRRRRKFGKVPGVSVEDEVESFANFCCDTGDEVNINKAKAVASIRRGKPRRQ